MTTGDMHPDEAHTDAALVRRLLAAQFPQWAGLPIEHVRSAGTDNAIYRLGEDMAVRLPRRPASVAQVEKEHEWLPKLAPHLPLAIPIPLAKGDPGEGYAWNWAVHTWLQGQEAIPDRLADLSQAAVDLAGFATALQAVDAAGGPVPGRHNFGRGVPLSARDEFTRARIPECADLVDAAAVAAAWEADLNAPSWDRPPVWVHGDLAPGNLLALDGRLSAVIDFGGLGVGDPAVELIAAWSLFEGASRQAFREALAVDDATWARGRGWALSIALVALPYYRHTNPVIVETSLRTIARVLADHRDRP